MAIRGLMFISEYTNPTRGYDNWGWVNALSVSGKGVLVDCTMFNADGGDIGIGVILDGSTIISDQSVSALAACFPSGIITRWWKSGSTYIYADSTSSDIYLGSSAPTSVVVSETSVTGGKVIFVNGKYFFRFNLPYTSSLTVRAGSFNDYVGGKGITDYAGTNRYVITYAVEV